ncbi:MAG: hypothetical protein JWP44_335 [Mucilaginibacter sp.]|nr:hypothetical protein [Mucilaginibacter sp.]
MDHFREIKNTLTWHNEGKFEVELVNGIIKRLNFCEPGKGPDDSGKSLTSTNYKFLQSVYNCLGDLFTFIEEENKRLGYRYAQEGEIPQRYNEEVTEDAYPMLSDSKIRPINNYANQSELANPVEENSDLIRDIG